MQTIGPYELSDRIAQGPMSDVYSAQDTRTQEWVALKLGKTKPSDPNYDTAVQRFQRESALLADVHHPALANFLGSGLDAEGHPYLALEWIEGPTLAKLLQQETRLSTRRALAIARQLASALAAIHAKGYIHSDIKPENVILQPDPHDPFAPPRARLMDFGVAGVLEADTGQTRSGVLIGTPNYMAPEQLRANALSPATDIWQLGILLFQMLTGVLPFEGKDTYTVMSSRLTATPKFPDDIHLPPELTAFLLRTLEKDPTKRPANGTEAEAILTAIQPPSQDINFVGGEANPNLSGYLGPSPEQLAEAFPAPPPAPPPAPAPKREHPYPKTSHRYIARVRSPQHEAELEAEFPDEFPALPSAALDDPTSTLVPIQIAPAQAQLPPAPVQVKPAPTPSPSSIPQPSSAPAKANPRLPVLVAALTAFLFLALAVAYVILRAPAAAPPGPASPNHSILSSAPWLGVLFGIALALLGIALGRTVRKLLAGREHELTAQAQSLLSGTRDQSHLSQTLAIQVDELVAKCRLVDEKILGMTMAVMVTEYSTATAFDDRQKALMNAVTLLDKLMPKLSPWYVRHDKLVALAVTLTGILSGLAAVAENVTKLLQHK